MKPNIWVLLTTWLGGLTVGTSAQATTEKADSERPNVLFIAIDDLNDWIGSLNGHPQTHTPNIDRFAERGMIFGSHHVPAPMCAPSRAATFLGRRPDTLRVFGNRDQWQEIAPQHTTLPGYFREKGYYVAGGGKVFHQWRDTRRSDWHEYLGDFTDPQIPVTRHQIQGRPLSGIEGFAGYFDFGPLDTADENMSDMQVAAWAESFLMREHEEPFFLAAGIFLPHLPWFAPQKYFDAHPLDEVIMPPDYEGDLDDIPARGLMLLGRDNWSSAIREHGLEREAVQAYLACIQFVDVVVGRIIDALDKSPYADNTIIVLWSDHGMHLGEKGHFSKFTLWERSARSPLIIHAPGFDGGRTDRAVNSIDIYPTLLELAGLSVPQGLDGQSLVPLMEDPATEWERPSVTIYHGDRSARWEQWRYIRYADGGEELYNHENDPHEWHNLASDPDLRQIMNQLRPSLTTP